VAGVAHEINNPLAFVRSHVSTAHTCIGKIAAELQPAPGAPSAELLARAKSRLSDADAGLERIRELVVKLRVFSRLDEGERKEVKVSDCVDSVLTILRHKFEGRIEVTTHYGHPDVLDCYPSLLNQAIMNLVSNSIDAIEERGNISISTGADADGYVILIADSGHGIPGGGARSNLRAVLHHQTGGARHGPRALDHVFDHRAAQRHHRDRATNGRRHARQHPPPARRPGDRLLTLSAHCRRRRAATVWRPG
jgi:K+-sensing histidine kinase KdpD